MEVGGRVLCCICGIDLGRAGAGVSPAVHRSSRRPATSTIRCGRVGAAAGRSCWSNLTASSSGWSRVGPASVSSRNRPGFGGDNRGRRFVISLNMRRAAPVRTPQPRRPWSRAGRRDGPAIREQESARNDATPPSDSSGALRQGRTRTIRPTTADRRRAGTRPRGRCALRDRHRPDVSGHGQVRRSVPRRSSGQPDDAGSSVGCGP